jgi:hypothetical protein
MRNLTALFVAFFWVYACGEDSNSASDVQLKLTGNWSTSCNIEGSIFKRKQISFLENSSYTFSETSFEDAQCETNPIATVSSEGSYENVSNLKLEENADIDLVPDQVSLTVNAASWATTYISLGYCGFYDWQSGQTKQVSGRDCSANGSTVSFANAKEDHLQTFFLAGDSLYLGKGFLEQIFERPTSTSSFVFSKTYQSLR